MTFPIYESDNYIMREINLADANDIFLYYSDKEFMRYTATPPHKTILETKALILKLSSSFPHQNGAAWAIAEKTSNKVVGNIGLYYIRDSKLRATTGYNISHSYQNLGLATWALSNCIDFGMNQLGLDYIEAKCKSVNLASERVMQKCGMIFKEIKKNPFLVDGINYDILTYSISR